MVTGTKRNDDLYILPAHPSIRTADSQTSDDIESSDILPLPRKTNRKYLATGILLTAFGISVLLFIGIGFVEQFEFVDMTSLPVVAALLLLGMLSVGGGFGMMMSAAPGFDDDEFDRLLAGNWRQKSIDDQQRQDDITDSRNNRTDGGDQFGESTAHEGPRMRAEQTIFKA